MADKKITELSSVSTLPDGAVFTAVDSTRSAGDQNVQISKADLATDIGGGGTGTLEQALMFAASGVDDDLEVGLVSNDDFEIPFDINSLTIPSARVTEAPVDADIIIDLLANGVSILSTPITIESGSNSSLNAATQPVLNISSLSKGDVITRNITQVGSTNPGKNLKITLAYEAQANVSGGGVDSKLLAFSTGIRFNGKFQHSTEQVFTPNTTVSFTKGVFTTDAATIGGVYQVKLNCDNNILNFSSDFYDYGINYVNINGVWDFKFSLDGDGSIGVIGVNIEGSDFVPQLLQPTDSYLFSATSTSILFNWTDSNVSPVPASFTVELDTVNTFDSGNLITVMGLTNNTTEYEFTGLTPNVTTYYARVRAIGDGVNAISSTFSSPTESVLINGWYALVNAQISSGAIQKTGGVDGNFDSCGFASGNLNVDGDYAEFSMPTPKPDANNRRFAIGVTSNNPSPSFTGINHAIAVNATYSVFENGVNTSSGNSYNAGDTIRFELANSQTEVLLKVNGVTEYTFSNTVTTPLRLYVSLRDTSTGTSFIDAPTINN